ncbi:hypothetical protein LHM76_002769 [Listeria monocytogenes]|nr:hypothetical protein [Listeria monocytogenes]
MLNSNQIISVSTLTDLPNVAFTSLDNNQISDINSLEELPLLEVLILSRNQISKIANTLPLPRLKFLSLDRNQISDISPIGSLTEMTNIYLANQQITKDVALYQTNFTLANNIKDATGTIVSPLTMSDNGAYANSNITWNLPSYTEKVTYTFNVYFIKTISDNIYVKESIIKKAVRLILWLTFSVKSWFVKKVKY